MCFIAILSQVVSGYPVVIAANRDESPQRPGTLPQRLRGRIVAGVDPKAGGTWLGVNDAGLIVGIANLASSAAHDPAARSRGLLCLDLLEQADQAGAAALLQRDLDVNRYNAFNLFAADRRGAWLATHDAGQVQLRRLSPGIHLVGNTLPDNVHDPKVQRGRVLFAEADPLQSRDGIAACLEQLRVICADHGLRDDGGDAICVHAGRAPTLSSSLIALHVDAPANNRYLHAQGPPCRTAHVDMSKMCLPA